MSFLREVWRAMIDRSAKPNLIEIVVTRPADAFCWEMTRPSNGRRTASPNFDLIAREAMHEVKRAGGRAIVVYDDQNSFAKRVQARREGA